MPRHQTHRVRRYYLYDQTINRSNCLVDKCNESVKGNHAGNLMRHLRKHHRSIFDELVEMELKKTYQINASSLPPRDPAEYYAEKRRTSMTQSSFLMDNIKKGCVEMVVMNCRPLSVFKDSGFLKIIEPILAVTNASFVVNDQTVQMFIEMEAEDVKNKIRDELKGKVLSVKLDLLTRSRRSVIVVNVQFIENAKMIVRSLTSFEFDENYNSELLFSKLLQVFNTYGIELVQIHMILYDMGVNLETDDYHSSEIEIDVESREDDKKIQEILEETISMLNQSFDDQIYFLNLYHTTLLTTFFYSAITTSIINYDIEYIISFVNRIRTPLIINYLNDQNIQFPYSNIKFQKDTANYDIKLTAIHDLLTVLLKCEDFLSNQTNEYHLNASYYKKTLEIKTGIEILLPTMKTFQTQHLTISDFYGEWLRCKLNVSKLRCEFSGKLTEQFSKYENEFLAITHISAAIYLDPRYQSTLTIERRQEAKWHIKNVWETFGKKNYEKAKKFDNTDTIVKVENNVKTEYDEFDDYIKNISMDKTETSDTETNIENVIEEFENYPRLQYKASILQFWEEHKQTKPELYRLSKVILGTPASQATITRCFATLGYLLTIEESTDETTLENVFIIRLYNQFGV